MKLLVVTQKVNKNDPILSFFHRWLEELSYRCESVTVICLEKGEYTLPSNVKVISLGKEENRSKAEYISRFFRYILEEKDSYDSIFVHMNQEYILLGALLWKIMGKKVFLWRNHAKGSFLTRISASLSDKVFYTSPQSYTARFRNAVSMPVGIDTEFFKPDLEVSQIPKSILFLGRISPVKKVLEFIEWLNTQEFDVVTIAGPILPEDQQYGEVVKANILDNPKIKYIGSVNREESRQLYQSHEVYVNMTPAGSFDKTIFEAAACECRVVVRNSDLKFLEGKSGKELRDHVIENHSLSKLMTKLIGYLEN